MSDEQHFDRLVLLWEKHLSSYPGDARSYWWGRFEEHSYGNDLDVECQLRAKETARLRVEILAGKS